MYSVHHEDLQYLALSLLPALLIERTHCEVTRLKGLFSQCVTFVMLIPYCYQRIFPR